MPTTRRKRHRILALAAAGAVAVLVAVVVAAVVVWLRQLCNLHPLLKVPENVEVSMRQKDDSKVFFLLNHQSSPFRIQFYKPMHDFLTGGTISGNYDLQPHGVLVLDEQGAKD